MTERHRLVVVHWEWGPGPHEGARFYAAHGIEVDGRCADWPDQGMIPLGATLVEITDGAGLDLVRQIADATDRLRHTGVDIAEAKGDAA